MFYYGVNDCLRLETFLFLLWAIVHRQNDALVSLSDQLDQAYYSQVQSGYLFFQVSVSQHQNEPSV